MASIVTVRVLQSHEVGLHRDLRLLALRDAPDSFGETFADIGARSLSYWEELTRSVTPPGPHVMFLACAGDALCGMAYGLLDRERTEAGRVGGMWVAPAWRRRGVGRMLLRAVEDWARERGLHRLGLWAPSHSPAAIALYCQAGFRETGRHRPLPSRPALQVIEMECDVTTRAVDGTMAGI
jgi:GNAT superfamily N-acetyltransferase